MKARGMSLGGPAVAGLLDVSLAIGAFADMVASEDIKRRHWMK